MKTIPFSVLTAVFGSIGAIFSGFSAWLALKRQRFLDGAVRTVGTIVSVSMRSSYDSDSGTSYAYYPRVEFVDQLGQKHTFDSSTGSGNPIYKVGGEIVVLYRPERPAEAMIDSFFDRWGIAMLLGFIGSLFLLFAVVFFRAKVSAR